MSDTENDDLDLASPVQRHHDESADEPDFIGEPEPATEESEFVFTRNTSSSSGDFPHEETPRIERSESEVTERLMTEQEIEELDKRLEEVVERLQKQRDDYEQWENGLNARRLKAFGRLKALSRSHERRLEVYEKLHNYIQDTGRTQELHNDFNKGDRNTT